MIKFGSTTHFQINMLDFQGVKQVATDLELLELVAYIDEHPDEYGNFILYGKEYTTHFRGKGGGRNNPGARPRS